MDPTCALDRDGLEAQRQRYARLAADVQRLERRAEALVVEFREGFDRRLLDEALEVERACCPFFVFELEEGRRRLTATVQEPGQLPALGALEQAIGARGPRVSSAHGRGEHRSALRGDP